MAACEAAVVSDIGKLKQNFSGGHYNRSTATLLSQQYSLYHLRVNGFNCSQWRVFKPPLGEGSFGHVHLMTPNEPNPTVPGNHRLYVLKCFYTDSAHPTPYREVAAEAGLLAELGYKTASLEGKGKHSHKIIAPFLGGTLAHMLYQYTPTGCVPYRGRHPLEVRLHWAGQLFWQVFELSHRLASVKARPLLHGDIKAENVTVTSDAELALIDLSPEFVRALSPDKTHSHSGSSWYTPTQGVMHDAEYDDNLRDVFAIKRVIYLPSEAKCNDGYGKDELTPKLPTHLISKGALVALGLYGFVDTEGATAQVHREKVIGSLPAEQLAALFFATQHGLSKKLRDEMVGSSARCLVFMALHFASPYLIFSPAEIERYQSLVAHDESTTNIAYLVSLGARDFALAAFKNKDLLTVLHTLDPVENDELQTINAFTAIQKALIILAKEKGVPKLSQIIKIRDLLCAYPPLAHALAMVDKRVEDSAKKAQAIQLILN